MTLVGTLLDGEEIYIERTMDDVLFTGADGDTYLSMKEEGIAPEEEKKFALDGIKSLELATLNPAFLIEYDLLVKTEEEEEEEIPEPDEETPEKEASFAPEDDKDRLPRESVKKVKEGRDEVFAADALDEIKAKAGQIATSVGMLSHSTLGPKAITEINTLVTEIVELVGDVKQDIWGKRESIDRKDEAKMGVDYVKSLKLALKKAREALKLHDWEAASEALEDVADDATDAAKAAKKMKRDADGKEEEAEKETSEEVVIKEATSGKDVTIYVDASSFGKAWDVLSMVRNSNMHNVLFTFGMQEEAIEAAKKIADAIGGVYQDRTSKREFDHLSVPKEGPTAESKKEEEA